MSSLIADLSCAQSQLGFSFCLELCMYYTWRASPLCLTPTSQVTQAFRDSPSLHVKPNPSSVYAASHYAAPFTHSSDLKSPKRSALEKESFLPSQILNTINNFPFLLATSLHQTPYQHTRPTSHHGISTRQTPRLLPRVLRNDVYQTTSSR